MLSLLLKRFSADLALYVSGTRIYLGAQEKLLADEAACLALRKETQAFKDALTHAGARKALLHEAGIAAAMDCGIQIDKPEPARRHRITYPMATSARMRALDRARQLLPQGGAPKAA